MFPDHIEHQSEEGTEVMGLQRGLDRLEVGGADRGGPPRKRGLPNRGDQGESRKHQPDREGGHAHDRDDEVILFAAGLDRPEITPQGIDDAEDAGNDQEKERR